MNLGLEKETEEKVMKVLKETNYTMIYNTKGLSQNKTFQILVVSDIDRDIYPVQRTSIIINSIIKEANKLPPIKLKLNYSLEKVLYPALTGSNTPTDGSLAL